MCTPSLVFGVDTSQLSPPQLHWELHPLLFPLLTKGMLFSPTDLLPLDLFFLAPCGQLLVSLSKRARQGWGYFGIGRRLLLFSPDGKLYPYMDNDAGLLTPATTAVSDLVPHSPPQALTASSADPEADLTPVASPVRPRRNSTSGLPSSSTFALTFAKGKLSWVSWVTLLTLALALGVMAGTGNVLQSLQLLAAMPGLKKRGSKWAPKHPRIKVSPPLSMADHCKRGHVPHWSACDTCCRSRMRGLCVDHLLLITVTIIK